MTALFELSEGKQGQSAGMVEQKWGDSCPIKKLPQEIMGVVFAMVCHAVEEKKEVEETWGDPDAWRMEDISRFCSNVIIIAGRGSSNCPGVLARVCRHWRALVDESPASWSHFAEKLGSITENKGRLLLQVLRRSKRHKLAICFLRDFPAIGSLCWETQQELENMLEDAIAEWTEFLSCPIGALYDHGLDNVRSFKGLKRLLLVYVSSVDVLPLGRYEDQVQRLVQAELATELRLGVTFRMEGHTFSRLEYLQLTESQHKEDFIFVVANCPNISTLVFTISDWEEDEGGDGSSTSLTVLPRLQTLCTSQNGSCVPPCSLFLDHITAPNLRELGVPPLHHPEAANSLLRFLHHSKCSLCTLYIHFPITNHVDAAAAKTVDYLSELFTLTSGVDTLHVAVRRDQRKEQSLWGQLRDGAALPMLAKLRIRVGRWMQETLTHTDADEVANEFLTTVETRMRTCRRRKAALRLARMSIALDAEWALQKDWAVGVDCEEQHLQLMIEQGLEVLEVLPQRPPKWTSWGSR
ncbi:hypothetical protein AAF712_005675 [Marasmius tenuissimus]|uniref:F-box domain-containing protein n=1 Tax=Marasmius tenuissimus TaxID=585030 RepID=A0ABR2ZZZ1_9AGAR